MADYKKIFPNKHAFLAVIHCENIDQTLRNSKIAFNEGCDGIFLINDHITKDKLINCYAEVRCVFPAWFVGLNILDHNPYETLEIAENTNPSPSGVWMDYVGFNERAEDPSAKLRQLRMYQKDIKAENVLLFGGIAFKYQPKIFNPANAAKLSAPYLDVITTSGESTGKAADITKIQAMKAAVGTHPLAIASGITPENVENYKPYADCFLVATGVSHSHTELDPKKVAELAKAISS